MCPPICDNVSFIIKQIQAGNNLLRLFPAMLGWKSHMHNRINRFFDLLELLNDKLHILHTFLVHLAVLWLLLLGIHALFVRHP
jgi:hypothetical protein